MKLRATHITVAIILALVCTGLLMGQTTFMYWDSNFGPIALSSITSQSQVSEGSSSATLNLNGDCEISADNSTTAQLSSAADTLFTEYKLTFDADGSTLTGSPDTTYETYGQFLTTPVSVTYKGGDEDVVVTVHVRASNYANDVADAGAYSATQTLTVHWVGP
ncbi:MAG TPA: hypothetical protein VMX13_02550 [Sedimentisphaerales bacterium]|nr:hypothetical protein [Sedimentisphaerales bacterium]